MASPGPKKPLKGRHQFCRRFSLQPSFLKDVPENDRRSPSRSHTQSSETGDKSGAKTSARHKIVVLGPARVGKTSIVSQFLYASYTPKYKRTVEEMHQGKFDVNGLQVTLDILDTSGAYEFPAMRALSISSGEAFVLVYDVNDTNTFEEVRSLRDQIHETKKSTSVPIVVVGNKTDLVGNREVDSAMTESVVTVDWENGFVETSAKNNLNVAEVFKELLAQAKVSYNLGPALCNARRRQSLPLHHQPSTSSSSSGTSPNPAVPSPIELQHLQNLRDRHEKRNSCNVS